MPCSLVDCVLAARFRPVGLPRTARFRQIGICRDRNPGPDTVGRQANCSTTHFVHWNLYSAPWVTTGICTFKKRIQYRQHSMEFQNLVLEKIHLEADENSRILWGWCCSCQSAFKQHATVLLTRSVAEILRHMKCFWSITRSLKTLPITRELLFRRCGTVLSAWTQTLNNASLGITRVTAAIAAAPSRLQCLNQWCQVILQKQASIFEKTSQNR